MRFPKNHTGRGDGDAAAGIEITEDFGCFTQRNDVFTRAFWDEKHGENKPMGSLRLIE